MAETEVVEVKTDIESGVSEITNNPMQSSTGDEHKGNGEDRPTILTRFDAEDAEGNAYVRSVPDVLLLLKPDNYVFKAAFGVTFLQMVVSCMVASNQFASGANGRPSFYNLICYLASTLAIMSSINSSILEFWINNQCLELMKKENPKDQVNREKDFLVTLYFFAQFVLFVATIGSISQQPRPVDIITNCTGLLLIQNLDAGLFSVLKIPATASHLVKEKLAVVRKQPEYSNKRMFYSGCLILYATTVLTAYVTSSSFKNDYSSSSPAPSNSTSNSTMST